MKESITKDVCLKIFFTVCIMLLIIYGVKVTQKCDEYQEEIEKRVAGMDSEFIECLENVDIKEMSVENNALPLLCAMPKAQ